MTPEEIAAAAAKATADEAAAAKATADKAAADKAASDKATADKATADKAAADKEAADKAATFGGKKTAAELAAEKKAADDKAAADAAAAKKAAGKDGDSGQPKAPDKYELTVTDEAKTALGSQVADIQADVEADAKANEWTNEEAQAELDARLTKGADRLTALRDRWLTETKADTTYGGAKLEETQTLARRAVNAIRPPGHARRDSFLQLLNGSGIGNNLEVVSVLADFGRLMGEDAVALGKLGGKTPEIKKDADVLFPSTAAKA